jgi:hypothetical protein
LKPKECSRNAATVPIRGTRGNRDSLSVGPDIKLNGHAMANYAGCGSDGEPIPQTEGVEDCEHRSYDDAPPDRLAWITNGECIESAAGLERYCRRPFLQWSRLVCAN